MNINLNHTPETCFDAAQAARRAILVLFSLFWLCHIPSRATSFPSDPAIS